MQILTFEPKAEHVVLVETIYDKLLRYKYVRGVEPNIIKLSTDIFLLLSKGNENIFTMDIFGKSSIFGIDIEIDKSKKDYIAVGYIE